MDQGKQPEYLENACHMWIVSADALNKIGCNTRNIFSLLIPHLVSY